MRYQAGLFTLLLATATGCTGQAGLSVVVTQEAAGANCPAGGAKVQVGDGAPTYVCNGAAGAGGQGAVVTGEPAGANCAAGGVKVQVGSGAVTYVCNGVAAPAVGVAAEPAGANCATGGIRIQVGSGTPSYVCNGAAGAAGTNGADGISCTIETVAGITSLTCTDGTSAVLSQHLTVGGTITGLLEGGLTLGISGDTSEQSRVVQADGPYAFSPFAENDWYEVWIGGQPATQTCQVSSPTGLVPPRSVTTVDVTCACREGLANCDGDPANGCETDINTAQDCGGCGITCAASQVCIAGTCGVPILSFKVDEGRFAEASIPAYSCVEACALLFGGSASSWSCSTDRDTVNHLAWYTGFADGTHCGPDGEPLAEDYKPLASYDRVGAFSAYLSDWCEGPGSTNYCLPAAD